MKRDASGLFFNLLFLSAFLWLTLYCPAMYDSYQLPKALGIFIAGILTIFAVLFTRGSSRVPYPVIFAGAFYLYCSVSLLFSQNHPSFYYGLLFFSPLFFFTSFYSNLPVKKIALFINIIMAIPLVLGLYQYIFKGMTRPYSSFGNPIFFGEFIAALFPILLFSLYYPGKLRLLSTVNIFLSAAALIMCSSRGVIISLLMGLAAFAWYFFSSGFKVTFDKKITWVVCSALILIWFIPGFPRAFKNTASRSSNAFSTGSPEVKNRLLLALVSIDIFRDSPVFGAGLGAIRRLNPEKQPNFLNDDRSLTYVTTSYSHNDYLQLAAETGGVGLLLFMAFAFSTAVSFGRFYPSADREKTAE
jgi:O-antigen ligase